jgi:hypothetical protein
MVLTLHCDGMGGLVIRAFLYPNPGQIRDQIPGGMRLKEVVQSDNGTY